MIKMFGKWRVPTLVFAGVVLLAVIGWIAAKEIRSPAQVAADTAPPTSSAITVPVVRRKLSTVVIVRGTVKYGEPQSAEVASSQIKTGSDIITRAPRRKSKLELGSVALAIAGRPVFVLPGAVPMHRDLGPGDSGPDVRQLERALRQSGLDPGRVDGIYDGVTAQAVSRFYISRNWDPFGPTDTQQEQIRTAQTAAAQAEDAHLQALNAVVQAKKVVTPAEREQARLDALAARDSLDTAQLSLRLATAKRQGAAGTADDANTASELATANAQRDQAAADTEVATRRAALSTAVDDETGARLRLAEIPAGSAPSEQEAAAAALRQATAGVSRAQAELGVAAASANAVRLANGRELRRVGREAKTANRDLGTAREEESRLRKSVRTAREQIRLADRKVRALAQPANTDSLQTIAVAAGREARRIRAEVSRLVALSGIQVPANELLFFRKLPLRVDSVFGRRGASSSGRIMTVTSSVLKIDSSLSVSDRRLVRPGNQVAIEEEDLGIKGQGIVDQVADTPGTNQVDPSRFYFSVLPNVSLPSLVGASVKLKVSVSSTKGEVLAVPASALSVGGDGTSRIQVSRDGKTELVSVVPGLSAEGLVEVRPTGRKRLNPGDLVIVGSRTGAQTASSGGRG